MVIRYDYLWNNEAATGQTQGKDRPACLVAVSEPATRPRFVVILPITHSAPSGDAVGIEIPPRVSTSLRLDDARPWVIVSEHNVDEWPNAGLQRIPGRPDAFAYGFLPPRLFALIRERFLQIARAKQGTGLHR